MKALLIVLLVAAILALVLCVGFRLVTGGWPWQPWGQGLGG